MRVRATTLFLFLFAVLASVAQTKVDSLTHLLNTQKSDTDKVITYLQLYESLKFEQPDQAYAYLNKSIDLSIKLDHKKGQLNGWLKKGKFLEPSNRLDSALIAYKNALAIAESISNRKGILDAILGQGSIFFRQQELSRADSLAKIALEMAQINPVDSLNSAKAYNNKGNIEFFRSNYLKSLEFHQKSLDYNRKDNDTRIVSLINLSQIHSTLKDSDKGEVYAKRALETAQRIQNSRSIAISYQRLGTINHEQKELEEAINNFEQAIPIFEKVKDNGNLSNIYYFLAKIYLENDEPEKAIAQYKTTLKTLQNLGEQVGVAYTLYDLGKAYFEDKNNSQAEAYFLRALDEFERLKIPLMRMYAQQRLSEVYAAMGNYQKAYNSHVTYSELNDSLFNADRIQKIDELEKKYQTEQKQQEIELLSAENEIASLRIEKQDNLRNYLVLAAFLLLVIIGVVYNRYQLKNRANSKLRELDILKTNFFTNISHEFRTPLTLISSPVQALLSKKNDEETSQALQTIHRNAKVLTNLTNQILDLSRLEAGELSLQVAQGNFKSFLKIICASFESLAVTQKIDFIVEVDKAPEIVFFDEDKIQKILNNLLSNAFKFTSKEGKVILCAKEERGLVLVSVKDSGAGIPPVEQDRIFERFQQIHSYVNTAGTGVGLTLSKELALLHKGDITIESEQGKGTTFILKFPTEKSAYPPNQIVEKTNQVAKTSQIPKSETLEDLDDEMNTSKKVALLIEDNTDLSNHMRSLLNGLFEVKQSINGKVGIEDALTLIPDIIVTDLMMPEVDGVELCRILKANEKTSHIPIIMLTAKADRDTKLRGLKIGADVFLTKPFDNEELLVRVQNLIKQRENLKEKFEQTLRLAPSKIEAKSTEEAFIKKALEVVDDNLSNSDFNVDTFQKELGMSRMQLHRKLRALTNFSASEFIRDIRLQRAADLLANKSFTVSEVAYSCGFNSVSYFTQCFKQKFGVSPSKHSSKT
jgi:signal transduction histidine kinase/DNA-binding response OmpR family regulator